MTSAGHEIVTSAELAPPAGYAHAVVAAPGRVVYLGGQTAQDAGGTVRGHTLVAQFERAADNLLAALRAAGGAPDHLVSLTIYVTDMASYRESTRALGASWRARFGRRYPAMALIGVNALLDPEARIELVGVAVVP